MSIVFIRNMIVSVSVVQIQNSSLKLDNAVHGDIGKSIDKILTISGIRKIYVT